MALTRGAAKTPAPKGKSPGAKGAKGKSTPTPVKKVGKKERGAPESNDDGDGALVTWSPSPQCAHGDLN
eukprot:1252913-Pyramimonas_sp.AAC.1